MSIIKKKLRHQCPCASCKKAIGNAEAKEHQAINRVVSLLHEKGRRQFAGLLALQWGRGGVERISVITGLRRPTIRRGRDELQRKERQAYLDRKNYETGKRISNEQKTFINLKPLRFYHAGITPSCRTCVSAKRKSNFSIMSKTGDRSESTEPLEIHAER